MILKLKLLFQQKHIMAERSVLMKNIKHPFLVGLHYSFQTTDKLYFVLDYVNGGEVSSSLPCRREVRGQSFPLSVLLTHCFFFSPAVLSSPAGEDLPGAKSQVLRCRNCQRPWLPPLPSHRVQVRTGPVVPPCGQFCVVPKRRRAGLT